MDADQSFDVDTLIPSSSPVKAGPLAAVSSSEASSESSIGDVSSSNSSESESDDESEASSEDGEELERLFLQAKTNAVSALDTNFESNADMIKVGVKKDLSEVANMPAIPQISVPIIKKVMEKPAEPELPSALDLPQVAEPLSRKQIKEQKAATAGPKWFNLPLAKPEWAKEAAVLRLRNELDPKKFYKGGANKITSPYYAIGHIIPENSRHALDTTVTPRIKTSGNKITDELLKDGEAKSYAKRKFNEFQSSGRGGPYGHKKKAMSHPKSIKRSNR